MIFVDNGQCYEESTYIFTITLRNCSFSQHLRRAINLLVNAVRDSIDWDAWLRTSARHATVSLVVNNTWSHTLCSHDRNEIGRVRISFLCPSAVMLMALLGHSCWRNRRASAATRHVYCTVCMVCRQLLHVSCAVNCLMTSRWLWNIIFWNSL